MKKILVTGGAGFIGSHIVDALIDRGDEVIVVDNLSTGRRENINPEATFYKADICDENDIQKIFVNHNPNYIIHEAAQISVIESIKNPVHDIKTNVFGTLSLLNAATKVNCVKKVVYASSGGAIYGDPKYLPADEKHPIAPLSPYGRSKYMAEQLFDLFKDYGIEYTALRYSNVYGPRQDPNGEAGVISIFINKFKQKQNPVINGDGTQTRDFIYVRDVVEANLKAVDTNTEHREFNIGTGKETSIYDIYFQLKFLTGSVLPAFKNSAIPGEVYKISLDCSRAKEELGWEAKTDIKDGLSNTVDFFKK